MEWLVCYKVLYEETADETAVYFWPSPYDKVFYASLALHDHIGKTFKVFCRLFFFLFFFVACVNIHEGQTDIRFGHDKREGAV